MPKKIRIGLEHYTANLALILGSDTRTARRLGMLVRMMLHQVFLAHISLDTNSIATSNRAVEWAFFVNTSYVFVVVGLSRKGFDPMGRSLNTLLLARAIKKSLTIGQELQLRQAAPAARGQTGSRH